MSQGKHKYDQVLEAVAQSNAEKENSGIRLFAGLFGSNGGDYGWVNAHAGNKR